MEVICAKSAGFCFGVRRAIDCVYSEIEKGGRIFTYGPIIHNDQVVADLGQDIPECLRQDDIDHRLYMSHADRLGSLHLTRIYRNDTASD